MDCMGDVEEGRLSCLICLQDDEPEYMSVLACKHMFHPHCLGKWCRGNGDKCPLCKKKSVVVTEGKSWYLKYDEQFSSFEYLSREEALEFVDRYLLKVSSADYEARSRVIPHNPEVDIFDFYVNAARREDVSFLKYGRTQFALLMSNVLNMSLSFAFAIAIFILWISGKPSPYYIYCFTLIGVNIIISILGFMSSYIIHFGGLFLFDRHGNPLWFPRWGRRRWQEENVV